MIRILYIFIEVIASSIILIPLMFIFHKVYIQNINKTFMYTIFIFYLLAVFSATGLPQINNITFYPSFQLIPFSQIISDRTNSLLNILLFIPLGVLLPLIFKDVHLKKTVLLGFVFSLSIELLQILTLRLTDVNDLITNTLGTLIGYSMSKICHRKGQNESYDLYLLMIIAFLFWFFIQPWLSSGLWNLILSMKIL